MESLIFDEYCRIFETKSQIYGLKISEVKASESIYKKIVAPKLLPILIPLYRLAESLARAVTSRLSYVIMVGISAYVEIRWSLSTYHCRWPLAQT